MTYLVHGATGAQGSPVVRALRARDQQVRALGRTVGDGQDGVRAVRADLTDASSLTSAYTGTRGVFVHFPISFDPDVPAQWAKAVSTAARSARPSRIVLSTSGGTLTEPSPFDAGKIAVLRDLVDELRAAELTVTVLAPRLFLENLLLPPVLERVTTDGILGYPIAADQPVGWSGHLDVADAALAALTGNETHQSQIDIGQAPGITGSDLAAAFSQHLGRPVSYRHLEPKEFGTLLTPLLGAEVAAGLRDLYKAKATHPDFDFEPATSGGQLLGIKPRTPSAWLTELNVGGPR